MACFVWLKVEMFFQVFLRFLPHLDLLCQEPQCCVLLELHLFIFTLYLVQFKQTFLILQIGTHFFFFYFFILVIRSCFSSRRS